MGYTFESYSIDMKKVRMFSETAYAEYEFAVEEAILDGMSYDISEVVTESAKDLLNKIKAVFKKIIESIKKFFVNLFEKIKSIFTKNKEAVIEKAVEEHPEVLREKVQIPDMNEINAVCGKRFMLRRKLVKEFKAGTLTRDKFDQIVAQHQSLGQRLRNSKVVTVTVGIFRKFKAWIVGLFNKNKKKRDELVKEVETIEDATEDQVKDSVSDMANSTAMGVDTEPVNTADMVNGTEVAQAVTQGELEDTQVEAKANNDTINIVVTVCDNISATQPSANEISYSIVNRSDLVGNGLDTSDDVSFDDTPDDIVSDLDIDMGL